jgi:hypothetical protein
VIANSAPDKDHLLLELSCVVELGADPTRVVSGTAQSAHGLRLGSRLAHSLPVEVQHLLDLLVTGRHDILDDRHEHLRLDTVSA